MEHLIGKVVEFTSKIDEMETYAEPGMRGRITKIIPMYTDMSDVMEHVYQVIVDYSEFDKYNTRFESANYYDNYGQACLTAREAGMYDEIDTIYMGSPEIWPFEDYFTLVDRGLNALVERFKQSGESDYTAWLETQLMEDINAE